MDLLWELIQHHYHKGCKMKKIKVFLEYQCFPMWVYNENGLLVENDLDEELKDDSEIDNMFVEIQSIYDGLYEDNVVSFEYIGFTSEIEKEAFIQKVENVISLVKDRVGDKYLIEKNLII